MALLGCGVRHMANGSEEYPPLIPYLVSSLVEPGPATTLVDDGAGEADGKDETD